MISKEEAKFRDETKQELLYLREQFNMLIERMAWLENPTKVPWGKASRADLIHMKEKEKL